VSDEIPHCALHPGRETLLSCSRCERPMCPDCLRPAAVGLRCVACLRDERRADPSLAASRSGRRPGWVFAALVAAFVALGALLAAKPFYANVVRLPDGTPVGQVVADSSTKALAMALVIVGWIVSLCLHEWAHAYTAYRSGDLSVVDKGYLTLDPRKYTDPILSLVLPLVFLVIGGIGLPGGAVWIDHGAIRSRHREALVSAAGPAVNLVFGAACLGLVEVLATDGPTALSSALAWLGWLQFLTAALNLLPIPGLDGYGIIDPYLPRELRASLWNAGRYGLFIVFFVVVFTPVGQGLFSLADRMVEATGVDTLNVVIGQEIARPQLK